MTNGVHLLTYADRLGGSIQGIGKLLDGPLQDFSGVHLLPFFVPFDGEDTGFDPIDHMSVDPRLGTWDDVKSIAKAGRTITADLIVNHISAQSKQFQNWLKHGSKSQSANMFLTFDKVFCGHANEKSITTFYRPRPGLPFTGYRCNDGSRHLLWTTFMPSQIDLDVSNPVARNYLKSVITTLSRGGVKIVRLDAIGYAIKTPGTDSFMTSETLKFVSEVVDWCHAQGMRVLVEVHSHYSDQQQIAGLVDYVYDFALPALFLHSLVSHNPDRLDHWLSIRPENAITVMDTHDGIGIIDAGPGRGKPGLINQEEMRSIFDYANNRTDGHSAWASDMPQWMTMPHQINATFPSVLGHDNNLYIVARTLQLFVPGIPQIYYVGLLNGFDDVELCRQTHKGRDINRHKYTASEVRDALGAPTVQAILELVHMRSTSPAFSGHFSHRILSNSKLALRWVNGACIAELTIDFTAPSRLHLTIRSGQTELCYQDLNDLAMARKKRLAR